MLIVFCRALILYILVIFSVRLMGKRQIGELQPSELVITILVSNIATLPIEDTNLPVTTGIVPILTLVSLDVIMSALTLRSRKLRRIVSGSPKIIISDGVIDQKELKNLRYSADDLMESLRALNIFDVTTVQFAIVETTGKISVLEKEPFQSAKQGDLGLRNHSTNPPQVVIDDGKVVPKALKFLGMSGAWLDEILTSRRLAEQDVYIMTASADGQYTIIEKETDQ
ncbi:MAG: DUF421 domain-containing protein [Oscillospiraceae bacterium]